MVGFRFSRYLKVFGRAIIFTLDDMGYFWIVVKKK